MASSSKNILVGPANEQIKELLSQSGDPLEALLKIQQDYGLNVPQIQAIFPLLDLCGYTRLDIHLACLEALNNAIISRIKESDFKLEHFYDIFDRTFPYIHIPFMQPVPMALLAKFEKHVDDTVLEKLKNDPAVFEHCPITIKRRIWKQDEMFFQQQMLGILNDYHHDDMLQALAMNLKPDSYQEITEARRSHPLVFVVLDMIGDDPKLYTMFVEMLRLVFESTPYASLSSLRADVLMKFHDRDISEVYDLDECHRLIWSLDTCVRNQNMDEAIISKIKECFDGVKNGTQLYGDFAMVVMDPLISNFLSSCIVKWLRNSVDEGAPENLEELIEYNAKLLNLGEHAPEAVAHKTKIPKLDRDLKGRFWNAICAVIVHEHSSAPMTDKTYGDIIQPMLVRSEIARKIFVHYLLDRVHDSDINTLRRCLPLFLKSLPAEDDDSNTSILHAYTYKSFLRTFISILTKRHLVECVADPRWRKGVMEEFLLHVVSWDASVHEYVVGMLAEYFTEVKYLLPLGEQVAVIADWADQVFINGRKEEKDLKVLHESYTVLLARSINLLDGQFQIRPSAVVRFCASMSQM
ncbi:Cofactor of BRCA1 [Apophysomyces sp. BC1034]|nr:Cofactor of BRCA1 [Apophysomyces sp. BC1015]KAG0180934.1 Cofactor of BRCA1 [Apophysomyces sp. BC1021]KAG0193695.1 Cofactor of BRCA1 [Apophysomyces sp. BC1034]